MTKAMEANIDQHVAVATISSVAPNTAPRMMTATNSPALSLSDLNIHSVPDLLDYLKDIYAHLNSQAAQILEMQTLINENSNLRSSLDQTTKKQLEDAQQCIRQLQPYYL